MTGVSPNSAPIGAEPRLDPQNHRHLFGQLNVHTPYAGHTSGSERATRMLSKFASRMSSSIPVGNLRVGWPRDDDTGIPAGYTYLAQLAAHKTGLLTSGELSLSILFAKIECRSAS